MRIIKRKVADAIRFGIDELLSRSPFKPDPHKVLFIRLDGIGDFVVWIDAARALAQHYRNQGKSPILVADSNFAGLAEALGIFDQVIPFDQPRFSSKPLYRIKLGRRIRGLGCTLAIQPTYSRAFETGDAVIHICGAKHRIGSTGNHTMITEARKRISDRWYTQLIQSTGNHPMITEARKRISDRWYTQFIPASEGPRMELIRNAEFVRSLLGIDFKAKVPDLAPVASSWAMPQCAAEIGEGEPFYVLFPGASFPGRRWPLASFRQVAEFLHRETGWRGVICGGAGDAHLASTLCQESSAPLLNWTGRTSLCELAAIFLRAKLLLANETSAVHLAEAVKLPTVCILGGGHFGRFVPYVAEEDAKRPLMQAAVHKMECFGCDWRCIYNVPADKPQPCIEGIGVDDVCQMIRRILSNSSSYVAAATGQQFAQSAKHN